VKVLLFANTDWYLYNFRLPLAQALRSQGNEVCFLSPPGRYSQKIKEAGFSWISFPLQRKGLNPFVELATIFRLVKVFHEQRPDIVHFFTIKPVLYGSIAAKAAGISAVINAVTGLGTAFSESRPLLRSIVTLLYRLSLRGTKVIFQTPDDLDIFLKYRLVTEEQAVVIPGSGVDLDIFRPAPEPSGNPVVMLAGRLLRSKGVPAFALVAKILRERGTNARFVLVGEPYTDNPDTVQQDEIDHWREAGILEAWGWHDDMQQILPQASIVCLPTTYKEGVPRILLEASACGRPVVATDIPGCRFAVRDGKTGILVPPYDISALATALETLLADPDLRRKMGSNGRKVAELEFSQSATIERTIHIYNSFHPAR
jgi:glycosyltransferase involved in cell wall biosynthesis